MEFKLPDKPKEFTKRTIEKKVWLPRLTEEHTIVCLGEKCVIDQNWKTIEGTPLQIAHITICIVSGIMGVKCFVDGYNIAGILLTTPALICAFYVWKLGWWGHWACKKITKSSEHFTNQLEKMKGYRQLN